MQKGFINIDIFLNIFFTAHYLLKYELFPVYFREYQHYTNSLTIVYLFFLKNKLTRVSCFLLLEVEEGVLDLFRVAELIYINM
uniref:Uncharacterized protein n=1 Tax=viral metagenome TaxID=1070528 RepID=A0A6C0HIQ8_9ZZZZ